MSTLTEKQQKALILLTEYCNVARLKTILTNKVFPAASFTKNELEEIMLLLLILEYAELQG